MIEELYPLDHLMESPIRGFYQRIHATNGVFIRAKRPGLHVVIPEADSAQEAISMQMAFAGTISLQPRVMIENKLSPGELGVIYRNFIHSLPNERLAWVAPAGVLFPAQKMSPGSVKAVDPFDPKIEHVLFDVHSHNTMDAYFSSQDNKDESRGFRVYIVIGRVGTTYPQIRARIGAFGHFMNIPIETVADLPKEIHFEDCYDTD